MSIDLLLDLFDLHLLQIKLHVLPILELQRQAGRYVFAVFPEHADSNAHC